LQLIRYEINTHAWSGPVALNRASRCCTALRFRCGRIFFSASPSSL
jgi:hypothetical protein